MRVAPISTIFAFSFITILTHALPFAPQDPQRPQAHFKRVPYSVVAVDGSSPSSVSVAAGTQTKTITQASEATETVTATLAPSILTVVATVTVSGPESEKTVFVTPTATTFSTAPVSMSSESALGPFQPAEITESVVPLPVYTLLSSTLSAPSTSSPSSVSSTSSPTSPLYVPFVASSLTTSATGSPQSVSTAQPAVSIISVVPLPVSTSTPPETSNPLTSLATPPSPTSSSESPSSTASETPQTSGAAQLPSSTVSILPLPVSTPVTRSSFSISFKTSNTINLAQPTPTTSCDDASWHTSYPAWSPTPSSISIPTSTSSIDNPSSSMITEKYGAATVNPPSTTRQDYLPTGGVASWKGGVYSGTSLKSWNATVV